MTKLQMAMRYSTKVLSALKNETMSGIADKVVAKEMLSGEEQRLAIANPKVLRRLIAYKTGQIPMAVRQAIAFRRKQGDDVIDLPPRKKRPEPSTGSRVFTEFYESWEWKRLRYRTLERYGRKCMSCNAADVKIVVDHIKPIRFHWDLRLDPGNVQILCDDCNMGKGSWDHTDFRKATAGE